MISRSKWTGLRVIETQTSMVGEMDDEVVESCNDILSTMSCRPDYLGKILPEKVKFQQNRHSDKICCRFVDKKSAW